MFSIAVHSSGQTLIVKSFIFFRAYPVIKQAEHIGFVQLSPMAYSFCLHDAHISTVLSSARNQTCPLLFVIPHHCRLAAESGKRPRRLDAVIPLYCFSMISASSAFRAFILSRASQYSCGSFLSFASCHAMASESKSRCRFPLRRSAPPESCRRAHSAFS